MTTITANITRRDGTQRVEIFTTNDRGQWISDDPLMGKLREDELLGVLKKAANWPEIRRAHFPLLCREFGVGE